MLVLQLKDEHVTDFYARNDVSAGLEAAREIARSDQWVREVFDPVSIVFTFPQRVRGGFLRDRTSYRPSDPEGISPLVLLESGLPADEPGDGILPVKYYLHMRDKRLII
jgi:hypothetical protein